VEKRIPTQQAREENGGRCGVGYEGSSVCVAF